MKKLLRHLIATLVLCWVGFTNAAVIAGNPSGDITMIFVYDYECPYCHEMYPIVQQLEEQFPDLEVKMMPVNLRTKDENRNLISVHEAAAAIAATNTNQFWEFTNQVMSQDPIAEDSQVTTLLNQMGLNTEQFQENMHSQVVAKQLQQGQDQMKDSGNEGVPLFIIYPSVLDPKHGITVGGKQSLQTMIAAVQKVQQKMEQAAVQQEQAIELAQQVALSQS